MRTRVFVIIPVSVAPAEIWTTALAALERHEAGNTNQTLEARFDRRSGIPGALSDPQAEGLLPARDKRILHKCIAFVRNLPADEVSAALVLPSGTWHGADDYGWTMMAEQNTKTRAWASWVDFYHQTLKNHADDYVVETWVHS